VDQAHEEIADASAILGFVKESVLARKAALTVQVQQIRKG
jgi:hypothetical protein